MYFNIESLKSLYVYLNDIDEVMKIFVKIYKQLIVSKTINLKGIDTNKILVDYSPNDKKKLKPFIVCIYNELWYSIKNPSLLLKASVTGWIIIRN